MSTAAPTSPPKSVSPKTVSPKAASPRSAGPSSPPAALDVTVQGDVTTTLHPELEAETYTESAYSESEVGSYTTSLSSSVMHYRFENGRRYHSQSMTDTNYFLPNDEAENDRLDLNHHVMFLIQKGKLHAAPLKDPQRILDVGTGTGIWAIEMADEYPMANVVGNDLSPIQPRWVPPNLTFEVDDVEKEWTHKPNSFDLVYIRYMVGSIKDWPNLLKQAFTAVKPGGYVELLEPDSTLRSDDGSFPEDSALAEWGRLFVGGARGIGAPLDDTPKFSEYIRDAGFVDISQEIFKLPNSPWAKDPHMKEVGGYQMAAFIEGLEALSLFFFTTVHGMTVPEIEILLAQVRKDMKNKAIHTYFNLYRYVARKPETA
ncbi:hypothetical protein TWF506_003695 [Arthrobotrys conoides]|uniref:Methyltransferase n=1 Tax=Arthrobotrys conoides TaxID=74498 RepID=A0AAN8MXX9_9PEZI